MAKIFITPVPGTARMVCGKVMTGGIHYAAVNKTDLEARNALALGYVTQLEGVELKDGITIQDFEELHKEVAKDRVRQEGESAEDYYANLVRFAVESLNSDTEGENPVVEPKKETTKKATASTKKTEAAEAEKSGE